MRTLRDMLLGAALALLAVAYTCPPLYLDTPRPLGGFEPPYVRGVEVEVVTTGYCRTQPCTRFHHGLTRSGVPVERGVCAADWYHYPRGTVFHVPGYGRCVVEDTGNKVKGRVVDLYFDSVKEAREWGRRTQWVTMIKWGDHP